MPIYSDLNSNTPTLKPLYIDIESVYQSIFNILNTRLGERIFLPDFGSELEDLLFDPIDDRTALTIYRVLISAIERWDSRVKINYGQTTVTPQYEEHTYEIRIVFSILGLEDQKFEYTGILRRS